MAIAVQNQIQILRRRAAGRNQIQIPVPIQASVVVRDQGRRQINWGHLRQDQIGGLRGPENRTAGAFFYLF